jgi:hypothetical protein
MQDGFVISDTTYAGQAASQFIVKAITGADTVQGGNCYVKDGIKKAFTIPRWVADYQDLIQDRQATPTSKGIFNVTGQVLTPADYMIYTEFNPRDYEDHWFATQLNDTLIDRSLPQTVESVVVQEVLKRHTKYFNQAIWNSSTTFASPSIFRYFNGWLQKAQSAADSVIVSSPITLTVSNIQGEMLRGYNLVTPALRYDEDMKYFVSYNTFDLYAQSQINQTYKGIDTTMDGVATFKGRKVVRIADMPDNVYLIARGKPTMESNLWIGINSISDQGLQLQRLQNNSELFFIKLLMKADAQIGFNSETVLYGTSLNQAASNS